MSLRQFCDKSEKCPHCIAQHWEKSNKSRIGAEAEEFDYLDELPEPIQEQFDSSKKRILDLGVSTGCQHMFPLKRGRTVIGYDNDETALSKCKEAGIVTRKMNLDELGEQGELACTAQLKEDLSEEADIFLVYILEYLAPEVLTRLLESLMLTAKPDSCFYIKTKIYDKKYDNVVGFFNLIPRGYIPSFFAKRSDMEILHHDYEHIVLSPPSNREFDNERLVIRKR